MSVECDTCKRDMPEGEDAWVTDWKVLDPATGRLRWEHRYTCDGCVGSEVPC